SRARSRAPGRCKASDDGCRAAWAAGWTAGFGEWQWGHFTQTPSKVSPLPRNERNDGVKYLGRILRYLRPHSRLAVLSVALMVLGALVGLALPWPLKVLVDNVLQGTPMPGWLSWLPGATDKPVLLALAVSAGFLLALLQNGLSVFDNYVNTKID